MRTEKSQQEKVSAPETRTYNDIEKEIDQRNRAAMSARPQTVRQWKERCEVNDRENLRKYHEILTNAAFALANSSSPDLRAFAQIIINISKR